MATVISLPVRCPPSECSKRETYFAGDRRDIVIPPSTWAAHV
jgi:hypothetical protein